MRGLTASSGLIWLTLAISNATGQQLAPAPSTAPTATPSSQPALDEEIVPTFETQKLARTYILDIPAPRGQITDRNGAPFAQNRLSYSLAINFPTPLEFNDSQTLEFAHRQIAIAQKLLGRQIRIADDAILRHYHNRGILPFEIATNLSAAFHTSRVALPGMKSRKWGRIINIASAHGLVASGEKAAYVAAKHGIVGLTKVVAIETANDGITCNAICPGWVLTPLVQQQIDARAKAEGKSVQQANNELLAEKQPMLKFSTPENVGALAVFLAGDAAETITGSSYSIDGGWVAQ